MICDSLPRQGDLCASSLLHASESHLSLVAANDAAASRAWCGEGRPADTVSTPVKVDRGCNFSRAAEGRHDATGALHGVTAPSTSAIVEASSFPADLLARLAPTL